MPNLNSLLPQVHYFAHFLMDSSKTLGVDQKAMAETATATAAMLRAAEPVSTTGKTQLSASS